TMNPDELSQLRRYVQQLQQEVQAVNTRLDELEKLSSGAAATATATAVTLPDVATTDATTTPAPMNAPIEPVASKTTSHGGPKQVGSLADLFGPKGNTSSESSRATEAAHTKTHEAAAAFRSSDPIKKLASKISLPTEVDWEEIVGGRWMTWLGAFTLLLAVG